MYEYVSDILRELRINPEDVMLIRHTDSAKDKEHRFRRALDSGHIKDYTAMQADGFAKDKDYLMVFIGEQKETARFYALYYIANRFPSRAGHVSADYPTRSEVEAEGEYLELREIPLPSKLSGFTIKWGNSEIAWKQHAKRDKQIIEITTI